MDTLVSIIIPIYNSEEYLNECIESVLNQSYKSIEVILINDGSTDNSINIIIGYEEIDSRIIVIDKHNSGQGDSRNVGISKARGKYILFLDSDDCLKEDCIEVLVLNANKEDYDMIVYNANAFYCIDNKKVINKESYFDIPVKYHEKIVKGLDFFTDFMDAISPVLKLYNTEFLKKNSIIFPMYKYGEDIYFWCKSSIYANKVCYINYNGYFRRIRNGSITFNSHNTEVILERIESIKDLNKLLLSLDEKGYIRVKEKFMENYCFRILGAIISVKKIKSKINLIRKFKKEEGDRIIITNTKSKKKKFIVRILCFNLIKYS